ncbi:right-handed parallel beta-helix repeat-containing protein [Actinotalea sp. K2]|uniref:right-handed parallel beta-helix repeat-containing protein n=1 Tax=Actinotalea sp. K2 TaxID=2939438 RepID=UPI002017EC16|nr:right-handed parallel beta-helix repeat-containing protein [Actinotalea sp. K2]MCL3861583.1 right-handed parallel beta-helix repeat-containing protein [Actinotalea sp. K2]
MVTISPPLPRRALAAVMSTALAATGVALAAAPAVAEEHLTWQAITFGQSTDLSFASNVLPEKVGTNVAIPENPGSIEGEIFLESRGGKLAPGHDGLTFYYVDIDPREHNFVLEADVIVDQLGPETGANPNGQEGAGLMVRDLNGGPRQDPMLPGFEEVPAASNLAGVSMMRHGVSPIIRTGVEVPWGNAGSSWTAAGFTSGSQYTVPRGTPVTMRLERTDTSFVMSTTFTHLPEPETFERVLQGADWVQDIDPENMTVGFFAARNAAVRITNASLTLSAADTQPRVVTPPPAPAASLTLLSPPHSGSTAYDVRTRTNDDGHLSVTVGGQPVVLDQPVEAGTIDVHPVTLEVGQTAVSATFTPTGAPDVTPITREQSVTVRELADGDLHVTTDGTAEGDGSAEAPLDLHTAVQYVLPGQRVVLGGGTYTPTSTLNISAPYSGLEDAPKTLIAAEGEDVVIDGRGSLPQVVRLDADHWHVQGFRITAAASNALRMSGSHNVVEQMLFNHNGDSGFQMTGSGSDPALWPSHNLILNSESHDNRDAGNINADGFAAKLGVGEGNVFRGNVAHHNIDDGWDLYNRTNEGANMPIVLDGNIAYSNGKLSDGFNEDSAIGVGFKLGGEGLPVDHVVINNLAFDNNMDGFSDNFNPGRLEVRNNTSVDNKRFNYIFRINPYVTSDEQGVFRNNLSVRTDGQGAADFVSGDVDASNFFYDGSVTTNGAITATSRDFVSLTAPATYLRDAEGSIEWGDYTRLHKRSQLNRAGDDGGHVGVLEAGHPGKRPPHAGKPPHAGPPPHAGRPDL